MEDEGILLRSSSHMEELNTVLHNQIFAQKFGDIKLVFGDGDVFYFKAVLAALSRRWGEMLRNCEEIDLVLFENMSKRDFLHQVLFDSNEHKSEQSLHSEFDNTGDVKEDVIIIEHDHSYSEENFVLDEYDTANLSSLSEDITKQSTVVTEEIHKEDVMKDDIEISLGLEKRIVSSISPNFSWPAHLTAPNYHSIRWGQVKSILVFEVMGNRSIFTLLSEKHQELPTSTAFSIRISDTEEDSNSGIFDLKDFVNGGTDKNIPAFALDGTDKKLTLLELMQIMGLDKTPKDENKCMENALKNINIHLKREYEDLKSLTNIWKEDLLNDSSEQKLVGENKTNKNVITWLKSQARRTSDGGEICCYCGFVCAEQSVSGNFQNHMKKHLYRRKWCRGCNEFYLPHDEHLCSSKGSTKIHKVPCGECGELFISRATMVRHLKRAHKIVEKVVTIRECIFCSKKVDNLSGHYSEFHKNELLSCKYCDRTFENPTKFKSHVDHSHLKVRSGVCKICDKECNNLPQHMRACHSERKFPCDHCDKVFKLPKTLQDHKESVNGTREKKPCPECGNLYVNLSSHVRKFHRGVRYQNNHRQCLACNKRMRKEEYADHKLICKEEETVCHICSKKVVKINQHLANSHQVFERKCYLCREDFKTISDLNKHLQSEYFPEILMRAGFVETDLQTNDAMKKELIANKFVESHSCTSEGEQFECKFCKYQCGTSIKMILHMKEHLGFTYRKGKSPNPNPVNEKVCPSCGKIVKSSNAGHVQKCRERGEQLLTRGVPPPVIRERVVLDKATEHKLTIDVETSEEVEVDVDFDIKGKKFKKTY